MINILQYHISLIQYQIHQPVINFQHKLKNVWTIDINGEETIIYQGEIDELNSHKNPRGKPNVNISIWRRKNYHILDLEEIHFRYNQVRSMVSYIEVCLSNKLPQQITLLKV